MKILAGRALERAHELAAQARPPVDGGRSDAQRGRLVGFVDARNTFAALRAEPCAATVELLRAAYPDKRWSTAHEVAGVLFDAERAAEARLAAAWVSR